MNTPQAEFASAGLGYTLPSYAFETPPELGGHAPTPYPVVIVGGGLGGLTLGVDLLQRGVPVVLIDEDNTMGVRGASSRGICYAQKSLETFARLGIYERIAAKGVQWQVGRTLDGNDEVYRFDLRDNAANNASVQPPFINIQQYYVEWFLVERFLELAPTVAGSSLRWLSKVERCTQTDDAVSLGIRTPQGVYALQATWLVDASGVNSSIRNGFGLPINGIKGEDRWCISDVRFKTEPAAERWTWIQAPFNDNRAVWQHLMADGVWRLDYQMAANTDMGEAAKVSVVSERLKRQFGEDVAFELVWVGPYGYRSQMLDSFQHGRVLFVGDVAHVMSPFGARGGNSAIQDADNLGWKLAAVVQGAAAPALLHTYSDERVPAAAENIAITRRTMRFLAPTTPAEQLLRSAVLGLAKTQPFAQALVNTGRMSVANAYTASALNVGISPDAGGNATSVVATSGIAASGIATGGGRHVQNVALTVDGQTTTLLALMRQLDAGLLIVGIGSSMGLGAGGSAADYAAALPAALKARALELPTALAAAPLALQLGGLQAGIAIVRPDLYCAGTACWADAPAMFQRLNAVLEGAPC
jgi:3-(3-hydroxy-phenyl)propionate hydroxylase